MGSDAGRNQHLVCPRSLGLDSPHATAADGHRNLVLTMAMDLSAASGKVIELPIDLDEFYK